jgi:hypothetical protein
MDLVQYIVLTSFDLVGHGRDRTTPQIDATCPTTIFVEIAASDNRNFPRASFRASAHFSRRRDLAWDFASGIFRCRDPSLRLKNGSYQDDAY